MSDNMNEYMERGTNPELTHVGTLMKVVPVYVNEDFSVLEARNWFAEYLLDVVGFFVTVFNIEMTGVITGINEKVVKDENGIS